jgi:hypothetical protein
MLNKETNHKLITEFFICIDFFWFKFTSIAELNAFF